MHDIIYSLKATLSFNNFPVLTIMANVFWGYALGKILVTPGNELGGSILIKVFLIIGTCLFFNYLLYTRKAAKGITCNPCGKIRPLLKELCLCAALNGFMLLLSLSFFFFKSLYL